MLERNGSDVGSPHGSLLAMMARGGGMAGLDGLAVTRVAAVALVGLVTSCRAQVHVTVDKQGAAADLQADPKLDYVDDGTVTTAPVATHGPARIPGEVLRVPLVRGRKGEPVAVVALRPGALVPFGHPDTAAPKEVLVRRHHDDAKAAAAEPVTTFPLVTGPSKAWVGFNTPQLPPGVYDVWYEGGSASATSTEAPTPPPKPAARQWTTIEIRAGLRPASAVVRGRLGSVVDLAVGVGSIPKALVPIAVDGFGKVVELAPGQSPTAKTGADGLAHFQVKVVGRGDAYVYARSPGYESAAIRVVGGPLFDRLDHRLQPGDVLECVGKKFVSDLIELGEWAELKTPNPLDRPWYSHVAVYLGGGKVAEMLNEGLVQHTIDEAAVDCHTVDVYRRNGVLPKQQAQIVERIRSYGTVPSAVPYAWGQIGVMGSASVLSMNLKIAESPIGMFACVVTGGLTCALQGYVAVAGKITLGASIAKYLVDDKGPSRMICSELAARAYSDAGAGFDASPWWPTLEGSLLLLGADARKDFTTPNMISHSKDMDFVFQLWPPGPPAFIAGGQVRLGEQVTFDFGSAAIRPEAAELLQHVADLLGRHPDIKHIRVEGHTDDIGEPADNQRLSEKRAEAVRTWLQAHGVAADRLSSKGFGEQKPLVPNNEEHNRRRNRRVEFHLVAK